MTVFLDTKTRKEPALHIKTLDDFFGSGWWDREPEHNTYAYPFIGRPLVETDQNGSLQIVLYKYHVNDPWWFHESIRVEIGENWNWGNQHISSGDWTTTAFFCLKVAEEVFYVVGIPTMWRTSCHSTWFPQFSMSDRMGMISFPFSVRLYSTFTGILSVSTRLWMMSSSSSSRSCSVSTLLLMLGMNWLICPNRLAEFLMVYRMMNFHLPPRMDMILVTGQLSGFL